MEMFIEDNNIFPTQFIIMYRDTFDNHKQKSTRAQMISYTEYKKDK